MSRGLVSRGDILRAIIQHKGTLSPAASEALGFSLEKIDVEGWGEGNTELPGFVATATGHQTIKSFQRKPLSPTPFWQPQTLSRREIVLPGHNKSRVRASLPTREKQPPAKYLSLTPFSDLVPRLREALSRHRPSYAIDLTETVERISQGEPLEHLPREHRFSWGSSLYVIEDRSDYLAPYVWDQALVQDHLSGLYPKNGFFPAIYSECHDHLLVFHQDGTVTPLTPNPGDQVLVLSDLGSLARDGGRAAAFWASLGRELVDCGARCLALIPCSPAECPQETADLFQLLSWEHPAPLPLTPEELAERVGELLTHLSAAPRIEPALLRRVRLLLGRHRYPACLESLLWQQKGLAASGMIAVSLSLEETIVRHKQFRERLGEDEARATARATLAAMQQATVHLPYEIWLETVINFHEQGKDLFSPKEQQDRVLLLNYLAEQVTTPGGSPLGEQARQWLKGFNDRLAPSVREAAATRDACWAIDSFVHQETEVVSPQVDPFPIYLSHQGDSLRITRQALPPGAGSPVGVLTSRDGMVKVTYRAAPGQAETRLGKGVERIWLDNPQWERSFTLLPGLEQLEIRTDSEQMRLVCLVNRPAWAESMGRDQYGLWAEFVLTHKGNPLRQQMRWIPPGHFLMGLPEDEPGRWEAEGPQHPVTLEQGFWLFATPVTQELWSAVMGENPSEFQAPDRPVEQVSWDDCQQFLEKFNKRMKKNKLTLELELPGEAEWEYSCRAGSTTALYTGTMEIIGEYNAPALHPIAWYGGNSGLDFDLEKGYKVDWEEKQFDFKQAGTRTVAQKLPNNWGLYDMLGNVWEWIADSWHDSYKDAPEDGKPWDDGKRGADRVVRGGSWGLRARDCRSAYRNGFGPGFRFDNLGFRCCARVQVSQLGSGNPAGTEQDGPTVGRKGGARPTGSSKVEQR